MGVAGPQTVLSALSCPPEGLYTSCRDIWPHRCRGGGPEAVQRDGAVVVPGQECPRANLRRNRTIQARIDSLDGHPPESYDKIDWEGFGRLNLNTHTQYVNIIMRLTIA